MERVRGSVSARLFQIPTLMFLHPLPITHNVLHTLVLDLSVLGICMGSQADRIIKASKHRVRPGNLVFDVYQRPDSMCRKPHPVGGTYLKTDILGTSR